MTWIGLLGTDAMCIQLEQYLDDHIKLVSRANLDLEQVISLVEQAGHTGLKRGYCCYRKASLSASAPLNHPNT